MVVLCPGEPRGVWSRSSPMTQPHPHSDKSPGGKCSVKLPGESPATPPYPSPGWESKLWTAFQFVEKSHLPGSGQVKHWTQSINTLSSKRKYFHDYLSKQYVYYRRLKNTRGYKEEKNPRIPLLEPLYHNLGACQQCPTPELLSQNLHFHQTPSGFFAYSNLRSLELANPRTTFECISL